MISFKTLKPFLLTALLLCALPVVVSAHVRAAGTSLGNRQLSSVNCQLSQAPASSVITFADPEMERLCLASWDTDGDGHLKTGEQVAEEMGPGYTAESCRQMFSREMRRATNPDD